MKKLPRARLMARLQDLIGMAGNTYHNDRQRDRAAALGAILDEAWGIIIALNERQSPYVKSLTLADYRAKAEAAR